MNKRQKEVEQAKLAAEKKVLKRLEAQYREALESIDERIAMLQSKTVYSPDGTSRNVKMEPSQIPQSRVYQIEQQKALKGQISSIIEKLHSDEYDTISEYLESCYTDAFIGTAYDLAGQGIPLIMPIDQAAAVKAIMTESKIKEGLYEALGVDASALKKTIAREITRGVATGLTFEDIARNVSNVSKAPMSRAKTVARTEGHRVQQASAYDAQKEAKNKGADVVKQWDGTLDGRTRSTHRKLDGQLREVDEPFEMDGKKAMFPGGFGDPAEDCNCRCASLTRARWGLDKSELKTLKERAKFFGLDKTESFKDFKKKYLDASKMATTMENDNDWSKAKPRAVTSKEKQQVVQYAKDKGVEIGDIEKFDGDIELLKAEIDTISKTCKEYGLRSTVKVNSMVLPSDSDFAITDGLTITFNSKALRDRAVTEQNIVIGKQFASATLEDIALHETGHIIAEEKNVNGLEIAKKAYYNVTGKYYSPQMIREHLSKEVSYYSSVLDTEIVSEVIVGNKNKPTDFTKEFILLMKGR